MVDLEQIKRLYSEWACIPMPSARNKAYDFMGEEVPDLIAEIETLRAEVARLRAWITETCERNGLRPPE